ncbi:hypothetical protein GN958_ATG14238 [Phytophthora infestans]|uniref:NADAR domain-containing protein n=1 Tax=Phytophthora infestans TaxID=4787 RepID=A0A8S9U893_PHYIN|nr:hypothetical protein GN958_ATG14238 [Phytophthora infestans]
MDFVETDRAVYFYGQRDAKFGFLSNFHPCEFMDTEGRRFYSSEQYFMKRKQEMFDPANGKLAIALLRAKAPAAAKKLGRQALKLKFSAKLLATSDKSLYEASRHDAIWGIGLSVASVATMFRESESFRRTGNVDAETRDLCFGKNLLGNALVEARAWLRDYSKCDTKTLLLAGYSDIVVACYLSNSLFAVFQI